MSRVLQQFDRYLGLAHEAEAWGVAVRGGGCIITESGSSYPPSGHPADHAFVWNRGRVLGNWQMVLITAGEGEFEAHPHRGVIQRVTAGDVLLICPGQWHRYRPLKAIGWTERWLELSGPVLGTLTKAGLLPSECRVVRPARFAALHQAVEGLHTALQDRVGALQLAELASAGLRVLGLFTERAPQQGNRLAHAVRQAERVFADRLAAPPSMPDLAKELGVNYALFRREFRRRTGLAPREYLLRLRLDCAQRLIGSTPLTLDAIAEQVGFSSAFHLSAAFKVCYAVSPNVWRMARG
jgi:AraC-like DNA-binding protein